VPFAGCSRLVFSWLGLGLGGPDAATSSSLLQFSPVSFPLGLLRGASSNNLEPNVSIGLGFEIFGKSFMKVNDEWADVSSLFRHSLSVWDVIMAGNTSWYKQLYQLPFLHSFTGR
jgi:hypothetical protein